MNVILDVDTGVDDAMALLLAARSPDVNLLGVTCVMGNVELKKVVPNTLKVLEVAGRTDVPVARGMNQPLNEKQYNAKGVHGDDGMGNLGLPPAQRQEEPVHAVEFLRRTLMESPEPITLIPLAPLTNIAVLLLQHPEVLPKIKQLYIMGGAIGMGNASATAEFNVRQDPEAADIVFRSGLPILMYGLEVFRQVTFTRAEAQSFIESGKPAAKLAGQLLTFFMDNFNRDAAGIGDGGCVASFIDPAGLTIESYPVRVELTGTWTRGQTVVDRRPAITAQRESAWQPPMNTMIDVAVDIEADRYRDIFRRAILG
ncbi:MAG: nucleoside hydrolase [Caldilineaceae bacterium]|nr:nucleoside hydrolase [Caldilineaceae bacterium]MCB9149945.1 nucleoside hydrolase [Caldilineaceae bacterium]